MYTNPSFKKFSPKATKTQLRVGCATEWYDHDAADAIAKDALGVDGPYTPKQLMYVNGWFAEYGWNDAFADYSSNSWTGSIVAGPFATQEEAYEVATRIAEEKNAEYAAAHADE